MRCSNQAVFTVQSISRNLGDFSFYASQCSLRYHMVSSRKCKWTLKQQGAACTSISCRCKNWIWEYLPVLHLKSNAFPFERAFFLFRMLRLLLGRIYYLLWPRKISISVMNRSVVKYQIQRAVSLRLCRWIRAQWKPTLDLLSQESKCSIPTNHGRFHRDSSRNVMRFHSRNVKYSQVSKEHSRKIEQSPSIHDCFRLWNTQGQKPWSGIESICQYPGVCSKAMFSAHLH